MKGRNGHKKDLSILIWLVFVWELLLFLLAVIVGHACGYRNAFVAFGVMGALLGIPAFITIFAWNGVTIIIEMVMKRGKKQDAHCR